MNELLYLFLAYTAFWLISFGFIFTIFSRQRKLNDDITMLKQLLDSQSTE